MESKTSDLARVPTAFGSFGPRAKRNRDRHHRHHGCAAAADQAAVRQHHRTSRLRGFDGGIHAGTAGADDEDVGLQGKRRLTPRHHTAPATGPSRHCRRGQLTNSCNLMQRSHPVQAMISNRSARRCADRTSAGSISHRSPRRRCCHRGGSGRCGSQAR